MSKTVKIPSDRNPWTCNINGVPYSYTAGSTQSVPDEVAALIQQTYGFPPAPPKIEKPWPCDPVDLSEYQKTADAFVPTITSPANGDVIKYDSSAGKWKNASDFMPAISTPQDGDVLVYDGTSGTWKNSGMPEFVQIGVSREDNTLTLDKTWQEIKDMVTAGKMPYISNVVVSETEAWNSASAGVYYYTTGGEYCINLMYDFCTDTPNGYPSYTIQP